MCTKSRQHFHGKIRKNINKSIHKFILKLLLPIHRRYIFSLERNHNTTSGIHRKA